MSTKTVKIAVTINGDGEWYGVGGSGFSDTDAIGFSKETMDPTPGEATYWLTAELPLPTPTVAAVTAVAEKIDADEHS